jgi:gamma-glutamylcyclotransferase
MLMSAYFAYGSNLDREQMRRRCPGAVLLARAMMSGYRLAFTGYSRVWQGPVATILPEPGSQVEGVLYRLAPGELRVLDRYEGHPRSYRRYRRIVRDARGQRHRAHVYVLPPDGELTLPSIPYLSVIWRAYQRFGFDQRVLREAAFGDAA